MKFVTIYIERKSNNKHKITKFGLFLKMTTKKLKQRKEINKYSKKAMKKQFDKKKRNLQKLKVRYNI